jgi:hypothetical protein
METKDLQLPPIEQTLVKPDHTADVVVAVVPVKRVNPVQEEGEEGGERETWEVVERIYPVRGEGGGERETQGMVEQILSLRRGEGGEREEISVAVRLLVLIPPLAETVEGTGAGAMADLEKGLDQDHICLTVEHHLILVSQ